MSTQLLQGQHLGFFGRPTGLCARPARGCARPATGWGREIHSRGAPESSTVIIVYKVGHSSRGGAFAKIATTSDKRCACIPTCLLFDSALCFGTKYQSRGSSPAPGRQISCGSTRASAWDSTALPELRRQYNSNKTKFLRLLGFLLVATTNNHSNRLLYGMLDGFVYGSWAGP